MSWCSVFLFFWLPGLHILVPSFTGLIDWLMHCWIDWVIDWSIDWLTDWNCFFYHFNSDVFAFHSQGLTILESGSVSPGAPRVTFLDWDSLQSKVSAAVVTRVLTIPEWSMAHIRHITDNGMGRALRLESDASVLGNTASMRQLINLKRHGVMLETDKFWRAVLARPELLEDAFVDWDSVEKNPRVFRRLPSSQPNVDYRVGRLQAAALNAPYSTP